MEFFDNPIIALLSIITSIAFTTVAAVIPPSGGNFIAGVFTATFAAFLGGEEDADEYEREIADEDI